MMVSLRFKTLDEIKAQCKAQGLKFTRKKGSRATAMISGGGGWAVYNQDTGLFFGRTDRQTPFWSRNPRYITEPWMKALFRFFHEVRA